MSFPTSSGSRAYVEVPAASGHRLQHASQWLGFAYLGCFSTILISSSPEEQVGNFEACPTLARLTSHRRSKQAARRGSGSAMFFWGISIAICVYASTSRIPIALRGIAYAGPSLVWEVAVQLRLGCCVDLGGRLPPVLDKAPCESSDPLRPMRFEESSPAGHGACNLRCGVELRCAAPWRLSSR